MVIHDDFLKEHGCKDCTPDMDRVEKALSAFTYHKAILEILFYACCYFPPHNITESIPLDKRIDNAGAIAKEFSKPIEYTEQVTRTSLKMDAPKGKEFKIKKMNLYTMDERGNNFQPLKHIFTFLTTGKIKSLGEIITLSKKEQQNTDKFNKFLIKVILNYGDFEDLDNYSLS